MYIYGEDELCRLLDEAEASKQMLLHTFYRVELATMRRLEERLEVLIESFDGLLSFMSRMII